MGRGVIVVVRTGQFSRVRREGWGDTWGFEVRPNEFDDAFQPLHQVAIPHLGLFVGEMWDPDAVAAACAADGTYDFFLTAAPLEVTGAFGPVAVR